MVVPNKIAHDAIAAFVVSLVAIAFYVSSAAMLFTGPLAQHLPTGIGIALTGGAVLAFVAAWQGSISRASAGPEPATVPVVAGITTAISAQTLPDATFATAVAAIILAGLLVGFAWFLVGKFKAGDVIRYVPYPVIGGFLAGIGWLMLNGGLTVVIGRPVSLAWISEFLTGKPSSLVWSAILMTVGLWFGTQRIKSIYILPALILAFSLAAHGWLYFNGITIDSARQLGWLMASFDQALPQLVFRAEFVQAIDWHILLAQFTGFSAVVLVSTVALLLSDSSLEVAFNEEADFNHDLKVLGLGNMLLGLAGGLVSGISISRSMLNVQAGAAGRYSGLIKAALCLLAMFGGGPLIALIPKPVLAAILMNMGFAMLKAWLIDARPRLALNDYLVIVSMVIVTIAAGYLPAVFLGVVFCCFDFAFLSAKQEVIRRISTRNAWPGRVDRNLIERQLLESHGSEAWVVELQGVLFFGSIRTVSHRIESQVKAAGHPPQQIIIDFARVPAIDSSAANALARTVKKLTGDGIQILISSINSPIKNNLIANACLHDEDPRLVPDIDRGIVRWEEQVLAGVTAAAAGNAFEQWLSAEFPTPSLAKRLINYLDTRALETGEVLFRQGDASDALYWVESGSLIAVRDRGSSSLRIRSIKAGSAVGEMGVFRNQVRSADVVAEMPSVLRRLTRDKLARIDQEDPQLASQLHQQFIRLLATRLDHANAQIEALAA